jgi:hypothetical protein
MLVPPDEDGKIRWPTNVLRMLLHGKDDKPGPIKAFSSPTEAIQHMQSPSEKPDENPKD